MKTLIQSFLFALISMMGCKTGYRNKPELKNALFSDFTSPNTLYYSQREVVPDFLCSSATKIFKVDSFLILLSDRGDSLLSFFDLSNGRLIRSFGKKGRGKGDFIGLQSLASCYYCGRRCLAALDITQSKILRIDIDSLLSSGSYHPTNEYYFPTGNYGPIDITNGLSGSFVSLLFNDDKRFAFYHLNDTVILKAGDIPVSKDELGLPANIKAQAYQGILAAPPDRKHLVVAYKLTDLIQIFNSNGQLALNIAGPDQFSPYYEIGAFGSSFFIKFNSESKQGYADVYCTNSYIYALYVGQLIESREYTGASNKLFVFDYSGRLVHKIILPKEAFSFVSLDDLPEPRILALADPMRKRVMLLTK